jgi:hypothetical protein
MLATRIGLTLAAAALALAPPMPADDVKLAAWKYPGLLVRGRTLGGGRDGDGPMDWIYSAQGTTPDDFDQVADFFARAAGVPPDRLRSNGRHGDAVTINDSEFRPLRLRVVTLWFGTGFASATVSRGEGERFTHVAVVVRGESAAKPPRH